MQMSRYFRGDFRDKADGEFTASRSLTVSGVDYKAGDPFDKNSVSLRTLRLLYENRKIDAVDTASDQQEGTKERVEEEKAKDVASKSENAPAGNSEDIHDKRSAKVVKGKAGYFHVEDEAGKKIGKATRDEAEAEEIRAAYERGEEIPD